jgi:hypothetical protein
MADLIDLDLARQHLPTSADADEPAISTLISAASRAVIKYCRRDFNQTSYDELYNGTGDRRLLLRQAPLISVTSVRYRPVTILKIQNNLANTPIARAQVTSTGITLTRVTSGVTTTDTSITWANNVTITAVQAAVNALGNGWSATGTGYDQWPSADIYCPNGISAGVDAPLPTTQGALTAAGQNAELKMHTYELAGFQLDLRRGWLLRAIPYTDPELMHPEDLMWPIGINNFRVQYSAGYASVPEDVQEATAELVASYFVQRGRDLTLQSETTHGSYTYAAQLSRGQLPERIRATLRPYRLHRVFDNQG